MAETSVSTTSPKQKLRWPWPIAFVALFLSFWVSQRLVVWRERGNTSIYPSEADWMEEKDLCFIAGLLFFLFWVPVLAPLFGESEVPGWVLAATAVGLFLAYTYQFFKFLSQRDKTKAFPLPGEVGFVAIGVDFANDVDPMTGQ